MLCLFLRDVFSTIFTTLHAAGHSCDGIKLELLHVKTETCKCAVLLCFCHVEFHCSRALNLSVVQNTSKVSRIFISNFEALLTWFQIIFYRSAIAVPTKSKKTDLPIIPPESEILPSLDDNDDFSDNIGDDEDSSDQDEMIADEPLDSVISEDSGNFYFDNLLSHLPNSDLI